MLFAITNSNVCVRDGYISAFPLQSEIPLEDKNISDMGKIKNIHNLCAYLCGGVPNSIQYYLTTLTTAAECSLYGSIEYMYLPLNLYTVQNTASHSAMPST